MAMVRNAGTASPMYRQLMSLAALALYDTKKSVLGQEDWQFQKGVVKAKNSHQRSNNYENTSSSIGRNGCKDWGEKDGNEETQARSDGRETCTTTFGDTCTTFDTAVVMFISMKTHREEMINKTHYAVTGGVPRSAPIEIPKASTKYATADPSKS